MTEELFISRWQESPHKFMDKLKKDAVETLIDYMTELGPGAIDILCDCKDYFEAQEVFEECQYINNILVGLDGSQVQIDDNDTAD